MDYVIVLNIVFFLIKYGYIYYLYVYNYFYVDYGKICMIFMSSKNCYFCLFVIDKLLFVVDVKIFW